MNGYLNHNTWEILSFLMILLSFLSTVFIDKITFVILITISEISSAAMTLIRRAMNLCRKHFSGGSFALGREPQFWRLQGLGLNPTSFHLTNLSDVSIKEW